MMIVQRWGMKKKTAIERRGRKNTKEEENKENNCNKEKEKGGEVKINELIVSSRKRKEMTKRKENR